MKIKDEERESMETVLGKPALLEFSESIRKMRMHLLLCSVIGLAVTMFQIRISTESPVFGLKLMGMSDSKFLLGLLAINAYMLAHFAWGAWDYAVEWWLRLGGISTSTKPGGDPQHSTLHNFWVDHSKGIINTERELIEVRRQMVEYVAMFSAKERDEGVRFRQIAGPDSVALRLAAVESSVKLSRQVLEDPHMVVAIERFDRWFTHFRRSQGLRWAILELGLPLILGVVSVVMLLLACFAARV